MKINARSAWGSLFIALAAIGTTLIIMPSSRAQHNATPTAVPTLQVPEPIVSSGQPYVLMTGVVTTLNGQTAQVVLKMDSRTGQCWYLWLMNNTRPSEWAEVTVRKEKTAGFGDGESFISE